MSKKKKNFSQKLVTTVKINQLIDKKLVTINVEIFSIFPVLHVNLEKEKER